MAGRDDDECIHLMVPSECSICNGKELEAKRQTKRAREMALALGAFEATYSGTCYRCGEWFDAGAPITKAGDGWIHWDCK